MKLTKFLPNRIAKIFDKVLENKYVLYFVFFLAIINLLGYLMIGKLTSIVVFVLIGYLTYLFNKNMIIVIAVPLVLTSLFMVGKRMKEGMAATNDSKKDKETTPNASNTLALNNAITEKAEEVKATLQKNNNMKTTPTAPTKSKVEPVPNSKPVDEHFMNKKNNRIDYASTIEDAYGDLSKILEGDGIKQLTNDTQKLMQQQMELANAMKSMSPLLEQAKGLLQGFDFKNLSSLASSFGAK